MGNNDKLLGDVISIKIWVTTTNFWKTMQPIGACHLAFWNEKAEGSQIKAHDSLTWVQAEVACIVLPPY